MTKVAIKRVSIITTEQNYKWFSMQEILPNISQCWMEACSELSLDSKIFNIDATPFREFANFILQSDLVVIIAFNEKIARLMKHIRVDLGLDTPFAFHLHGLATIGLWPLAKFNVLKEMNEGDTFIGTCPGDLACMKITSPNAKSITIPYPYYPFKEVNKTIHAEKVFVYVGRLSDQKNINLLIDAYHILFSLDKDIPRFFIYGKEDFLGSPNMGIDSTLCLENLNHLIEQYKLEDQVILKGFRPRDEIYQEINHRHIFVSASTHSDENFGMALMRSLSGGATAVVSDWGGHKVFGQHAKKNIIKLCPVSFVHSRPVVDSHAFADLMRESLIDYGHDDRNHVPTCFYSKCVVNQLKGLILEYQLSPKPVQLSTEARKLHEQQNEYESIGLKQKAFSSYDDPIAQLFLKAYAE